MLPAMADQRFRVAVLASGGGTNLQALLDACTGPAPARIELVLSNNPQAGALARAEKAGVPWRLIENPRDGKALNQLLGAARPDMVVLAGYLKLVPAETVAAYEGRMINIHPALLPAFGGPGMYGHRVHESVIASGAKSSGASIHLVTAEYDRGPIIAQETVPVQSGDTADTLAARVLSVEHRLLPAVVLAAARAGKVVPLSR
jgi:formyltetrahydrofolate-dependent phosphoribosylglycinamide formyltransferase